MPRSLVLLVGVLLAISTPLAAQDLADVQIRSTRVAGPVYMLEGRGGNLGASVGADGVLLVDDQFAPLAEKIRAALAALGPGQLQFVLNTHWHGDHTGGNPFFGALAPILAHTNVRRRLSEPQTQGARRIEPLPAAGLPVITFDDGLSVHLNGEEIRVVHYPHGHTDGDAVVFFTGSNVVHLGDLFFSGRFPVVDLDHGGDVEGLIANVARILRELPEGAKLIPGHGPLSTAAELEAYLSMLRETTAVVRAGIDAGRSLDEIRAAGLPEAWAAWGKASITTERWIETVHRSLTSGRLGAGTP